MGATEDVTLVMSNVDEDVHPERLRSRPASFDKRGTCLFGQIVRLE